jgi:polysaccharide pyruvyl transferase WcaK-like protein
MPRELVLAEGQDRAEVFVPALPTGRTLRVGLFGCPLDTGNRGVSALGVSAIDALTGIAPGLKFTLFDFGDGEREIHIPGRNGDIAVETVGCYHSRRYYRLNNLAQMLLASRVGLRRVHPMLRRLSKLDAIFDISGGDSFSDIYGTHRFTGVALPKLLALELGLPLVLLPQTYGPYNDPRVRETARGILTSARQVWARDARSLEVARNLLGPAYDAQRHRCGADVAFGLGAARPADARLADGVVDHRRGRELLVGLNISGLLYNVGDEGVYGSANADRERFAFLDSYVEIIDSLLGRLVRIPGVRVLLVPHVTAHTDPTTGDAASNRTAIAKLSPSERERVLLVEGDLGPMELKWVIGQCDWFCGTRMHACIAALSQGVPAAAIAYSDKTRGVFETAGVGGAVVDPRVLRREMLVKQLLEALDRRDSDAAALRRSLPLIRESLTAQFEAMLRVVV